MNRWLGSYHMLGIVFQRKRKIIRRIRFIWMGECRSRSSNLSLLVGRRKIRFIWNKLLSKSQRKGIMLISNLNPNDRLLRSGKIKMPPILCQIWGLLIGRPPVKSLTFPLSNDWPRQFLTHRRKVFIKPIMSRTRKIITLHHRIIPNNVTWNERTVQITWDTNLRHTQ